MEVGTLSASLLQVYAVSRCAHLGIQGSSQRVGPVRSGHII